MIEPKEKVINNKTFVLSKVPAVTGRRIFYKYPTTSIPLLENFEENEKAMYELISYVGVKFDNDKIVMLSTEELVNNHTGDWETLFKLELAMLEYNCSFLNIERALNFLKEFVQTLPQSITEMSMQLLEQLSQKIKQHSTS